MVLDARGCRLTRRSEHDRQFPRSQTPAVGMLTALITDNGGRAWLI